MDITSILGLVIGTVLIVFVGITPAKLGNFWDAESVAIVVGGALAAVIASYPLGILKTVLSHTKMLLQGNKYNIAELVNTLEEMAQLARKNGLLALEEKANELDDMFFKQGIMLIVDATEPEEVRSLLENDVDAMAARHEESIGIYDKASAYSPAFGMIGTLVGLVNMLKGMNLDGDGSADIGPAMATALITTFYGCILANLIFSPIAKKLRVRNEEELLYKQIMIEGILAIQAGDNPKFLKEKLVTYVSQKQRQRILDPDAAPAKKGKKGKDEE
ncbi:motility protein A [Lachnospiraceae bacterium 42-17]|uniref:motility protein A n=1 Tax=Sporofaciens musculi TaxID=2681861 RepID=UPI00217442A4|nr:motility protein A [Sporofaciens musculi]MCI9216995.1 motility protein A [Dorea sp.]